MNQQEKLGSFRCCYCHKLYTDNLYLINLGIPLSAGYDCDMNASDFWWMFDKKKIQLHLTKSGSESIFLLKSQPVLFKAVIYV